MSAIRKLIEKEHALGLTISADDAEAELRDYENTCDAAGREIGRLQGQLAERERMLKELEGQLVTRDRLLSSTVDLHSKALNRLAELEARCESQRVMIALHADERRDWRASREELEAGRTLAEMDANRHAVGEAAAIGKLAERERAAKGGGK